MAQTFVVVGANLAGGTAAATLREEGFDGSLVLLGDEPHPPYERPPLSKEYLRGEAPFERSLVRPPEFYEASGIETRFGVRAVRVNPAERVVELAGGDRLPYDRVLIATGGRNRRPPIPGLELEGVHDLRRKEDADRIRAEVAPGRRAVVVGMGFIGAEVAASLRQSGVEVAAVEPLPTPLFGVLGGEVGGVLGEIHRDHGVELHLGDSVAAFEGGRRVAAVKTREGERIECDFAVVGVGIEPATEVVAGTDVAIGDGILVDERCRTSVGGVYAAGDVANHYHPVFGRRVRVEHWQNAMKQGRAAALNMLGRDEPYEEVHWFWSDQYEDNIQYAGHHAGWDQLVVRGSLEERSFVAFYLEAGRVMAAVALNRGKDLRRSMAMIRSGVAVDPSKLRDPDVDVRSLAAAGS